MYSESDGELAVRLARQTIDSHAKGRGKEELAIPKKFKEKSGVFVTIDEYPSQELRGCIGYPEPVMPLDEAIVEAAEGACEDPRFPPLSEEELDHIVVEVSILTPPEQIKVEKPKYYPKAIEIGRDGLIAEKGPFRGLLLPQVPVEWKWAKDEFLSHTCMKAGLMPDAWLEDDTKIYKFQAEIFREVEPRGKVARREIGGPHEGH